MRSGTHRRIASGGTELMGSLQQCGLFAIAPARATLSIAMHRFRQGWSAQRAGLGVSVIFALVLQTFVAATAPIATLDSPARVTCMDAGLRPDLPRGAHRHCHGVCCILGCAACSNVPLAGASGVAILPTRIASAIKWSVTPAIASCLPLKVYFGARGPPQII